MAILIIIIIGFLLLEISNVIVLFFIPASMQVHGIWMFPAWEKSKCNPDVHNLMRYLTIWVARSKLKLVALLIVMLIWGNQQLIILARFALVLSMVPFYFGLFPAMKKIDENDQFVPEGFSMRLGFTITVLLLALLIGSILAIFGVG